MLTAPQKLKWHIMKECEAWPEGEEAVGEFIDNAWDLQKKNLDWRWMNAQGQKTSFRGEYSRNYSCEILATEMPDGSWVAWPHWYGGGKHGDSESIPWIEDAFDIEVWTETREVRCFAKLGERK